MQLTRRIFRALIVVAIFISGSNAFAQRNVITTGVSFLNIAPDSRAGGMGDLGVATSPDATSQFWNPAKYIFAEEEAGLAVQYSPWLREIVKDMGLYGLTGYYKLDDKQAIGASLRYFSLGNIEFRDNFGNSQGEYSPNEFAIDLSYSRKLTDHLSMAVAGRFINSNLTLGQNVGTGSTETKAATSYAADVALYYQRDVNIGEYGSTFSFGANISNIGTKITYSAQITGDDAKDFIPTNLKLGPALKMNLDEYNSITFAVELNKLLVPTPPRYTEDGEFIGNSKDDNVTAITGIFQSFNDAPNGFEEELSEINIGVGLEYWYDEVFAVRAGYFHEPEDKGNRKYFTAGAGLKYNVFNLDFSYLIAATEEQHHPLDGTLRFTLSWAFANN
jgi:hypothetical protein